MHDGRKGGWRSGSINGFEGLLAATAAHSGFIAARMDITPRSAAALTPTGLLLLHVLHATAAPRPINGQLLGAHYIKKTFRTNINQLELFFKKVNQSRETDGKTKCFIIPQNRGVDL